MYKEKTIGVVIPCYNEETQIARVIETMPDLVDKIIVVDDKSKDKTVEVVKKLEKKHKKVLLIEHKINQGVGGSIASGYKWCRDNKIDIAVVMAGDGQMLPKDLPSIVDPVAKGKADYSKANRLFSGEAYKKIPKVRYFGNSILSFLTKIASGYWHVMDSQTGYTAINSKMLKLIDWDKMYKRYGQPNDLLVRLNVYNARVCDVPIEPTYGLAFFVLVNSLFPFSFKYFFFSTGAFSLANIIGYLAFFTPSGLGVREGIIIFTLKSIIPIAIASAVSLLSRLWIIIGELTMALFVYFTTKNLAQIFVVFHIKPHSKSRKLD